jgi:cation transport regulator ChaC
LSYALAKSARADRSLVDPDLLAALAAMTKAYDTLVNSGLYYETPITGAAQQAIAAEVQQMVKEYREAEQTHVGSVRLRDSEVLQALVFLVRTAHRQTSGRLKSRAFVDFLLAQFPEKDSVLASAGEAGSRIITP